jgi:protein subunit release factor B
MHLYLALMNFKGLMTVLWKCCTPIAMPAVEFDAELTERMRQLRIREEDLEETFTRGSGPGGQKINKTSSTVQLKHLPSGIEVRCQRERSQLANRYWARWEICEALAFQKEAKKLEVRNALEKKRRQTRKRPKSLQEKILKAKHHRSEIKKQRGRVTDR